MCIGRCGVCRFHSVTWFLCFVVPFVVSSCRGRPVTSLIRFASSFVFLSLRCHLSLFPFVFLFGFRGFLVIFIFGLVFFVLKSLLGIARQWSREKFEILTLKPRSHVRILIYRTGILAFTRLTKQHQEKASSLFADVLFFFSFFSKTSATA